MTDAAAPTTAPLVTALDHLVLTVSDLNATLGFYSDVLGLRVELFGEGRTALHCGDQKINLHVAGREFEPKARRPMPGSADLCFLSERSIDEVMAALAEGGVAVEQGPVGRLGAVGRITSVYVRDPDGNLVEVGSPG